MADFQTVMDFLFGRNELSPALEKIEADARKVFSEIEFRGAQLGIKLNQGIDISRERNRFDKLSRFYSKDGYLLRKSFEEGLYSTSGIKAFDIETLSPKIRLDPLKAFNTEMKYVMSTALQTQNILKNFETLGRLDAMGQDVKSVIDEMTVLGKESGLTGNQIEKAMKRGAMSAQQFNMNMLSIMFAGMAMQRAFGGMLRAITTTFMKAEDETSALGNATQHLTAAWEFFKFSLFDALNTPFFVNIIEGVINVIDWFSGLSDTSKLVFLGIVGGLALIGTSLFLIGQMSLGWNAIIGTSLFKSTLEKIGTVLGVQGLLGWILGIGIALVLLKFAWDNNFGKIRDITSEHSNTIIESFEQMYKSIIESGKGIFNTLDGLFSGNFDLFMVGLNQLGVGLLRFGNNAGVALSSLFLGIVRIIVNSIYDLVQFMVDGVFSAFEDMASSIDSLFGTDLSSQINIVRKATNNILDDIQNKVDKLTFGKLQESITKNQELSNSMLDDWSSKLKEAEREARGLSDTLKEIHEIKPVYDPTKPFSEQLTGTQPMSMLPELKLTGTQPMSMLPDLTGFDTEIETNIIQPFKSMQQKLIKDLDLFDTQFDLTGTNLKDVTDNTILPALTGISENQQHNLDIVKEFDGILNTIDGKTTYSSHIHTIYQKVVML